MTSDFKDRRYLPNVHSPYTVGYGKPPVENQFKQGSSGNPNGRPRKPPKVQVRSLNSTEDILVAEAYRPITVRENDQATQMPMIQGVMRSLGVAALKGSHRAQLAYTSIVSASEKAAWEARLLLIQTIIEYKAKCENEFRRCDKEGRPRPEPIPHPHEIRINIDTGEIIYNGPVDDAQKASWDKSLERRQAGIEEIEELRQFRLESDDFHEHIDQDIARELEFIDQIDRTLPDKETRRAPNFNIHIWRRRQKQVRVMRETIDRRNTKAST